MEISQFRGFSELMEDPQLTCFNSNWPFNSFSSSSSSSSFDDLINILEPAAFGDHLNSQSPHPMFDSHYKSPIIIEQQPSHYDHSMLMINHNNPRYATNDSSPSSVSYNNVPITTRLNTTTPHDHILAERKRRERLSQRFIALSALVPDLKKMDKASVLGDAIKYLKNLKEKVKTLEEQTNKKSNIQESVVFVKRYEVLPPDGSASSSDDKLPEIEAKFSGKDVLIRVHCKKKTGMFEETLAQIQKLNLSIINTSAITFATFALDITVVAQMDQEFRMTMKDLVNNLHTGLKRFM